MKKKDPIVKLEASRSSIKDLFNDLLNETKGFRYQITVKILLKKIQAQWRNWISSSLFQFSDKNNDFCHRFTLENPFQEILYMIHVWNNNGSGWNVESI